MTSFSLGLGLAGGFVTYMAVARLRLQLSSQDQLTLGIGGGILVATGAHFLLAALGVAVVIAGGGLLAVRCRGRLCQTAAAAGRTIANLVDRGSRSPAVDQAVESLLSLYDVRQREMGDGYSRQTLLAEIEAEVRAAPSRREALWAAREIRRKINQAFEAFVHDQETNGPARRLAARRDVNLYHLQHGRQIADRFSRELLQWHVVNRLSDSLPYADVEANAAAIKAMITRHVVAEDVRQAFAKMNPKPAQFTVGSLEEYIGQIVEPLTEPHDILAAGQQLITTLGELANTPENLRVAARRQIEEEVRSQAGDLHTKEEVDQEISRRLAIWEQENS